MLTVKKTLALTASAAALHHSDNLFVSAKVITGSTNFLEVKGKTVEDDDGEIEVDTKTKTKWINSETGEDCEEGEDDCEEIEIEKKNVLWHVKNCSTPCMMVTALIGAVVGGYLYLQKKGPFGGKGGDDEGGADADAASSEQEAEAEIAGAAGKADGDEEEVQQKMSPGKVGGLGFLGCVFLVALFMMCSNGDNSRDGRRPEYDYYDEDDDL